MTALSRNPSNIDLLQSTKFRLTFDRLPGLTYFCQTANFPGVSLTEVMRNTPFVDLYAPGEKIVYDTFNVTFIVDEDLRSWTEVHDWIRSMTFPTSFEEYASLSRQAVGSQIGLNATLNPQYSAGALTLFTNKNNPNFRLKFVDLFPTSLSTIILNTQDTAEVVITADATFRFAYYNYERI